MQRGEGGVGIEGWRGSTAAERKQENTPSVSCLERGALAEEPKGNPFAFGARVWRWWPKVCVQYLS